MLSVGKGNEDTVLGELSVSLFAIEDQSFRSRTSYSTPEYRHIVAYVPS